MKRGSIALLVVTLLGSVCAMSRAQAQSDAMVHFKRDIQPLLSKYCYDCHADGVNKGKVAFDGLKTESDVLNRDLWQRALKNLSAGIMPPTKADQPTVEERKTIAHWIKKDVFAIDSSNPDPGRVTIRRLNRLEYRNTIHDLMGIE